MGMIKDKCDTEGVEKIIALGYPANKPYLDDLLSFTCDPNWPVAGPIHKYFRSLGKKEVERVKNTASNADSLWWRYSIIEQIMSHYDDDTIKECTDWLKWHASQAATEECDIVALRILAERKLIGDREISKITKRNLFVYNLYIKETLEIAESSINKFPLSEHTL
jgi:Domain of unknown function (DUF5071)